METKRLIFFFFTLFILTLSIPEIIEGVQILSKSKLEKCEKASDSPNTLNCTNKVIVNMAVPSGSSGGEASIVAEIVEVEENSTSQKMQTVRIPPVITVNKSSAYAIYDITYIRDVSFKPVEYFVRTRKCERDAGAKVVKICERLRDEEGHIIEHTQPTCCPCGPKRRVPSSCGNIFDKMTKGKANTAHCLRFPGDWFHVFGIGRRSLGFTVRIEVRKGTKISADQSRIKRKQYPLYGVEGRFERINQHPHAGTHSFSIGITEVLNSNLLIELSADDIEYVYQRSPGKILSITIPSFEALTQFGTATIRTKNVGKLEASYSLTFDCSRGVTLMEEQFFIMKPEEVAVRSFKLYLTTDQASKYACAAILKDSDFSEVDRAECQFTTTATVLDNGSQITPFEPPTNGNGFFGSIQSLWRNLGDSFIDFLTGRTCRSKCSGFFDFRCHIQYICLSWVMLFGLFLAIFPTVVVLLWLLHQKGVFDPLYEWWEDQVEVEKQRPVYRRREIDVGLSHPYPPKHHRHEGRHYTSPNRRRGSHYDHHKHNRHRHRELATDYYQHTHDGHLHRVHKSKHKHSHHKNLGLMLHDYSEERQVPNFKQKMDSPMDELFEHHIHKKGKRHI